jgi:lysophospholipase L1-like esterase
MHRLRIRPLISAALLFATWLQAKEAKPDPTPAMPHPALMPITDQPGLPRVLLIGDSISMDYTLPVRAHLRGRANIHHPPENCGDTGRGLRRLDPWLGSGHWDLIHFNFGLHDLKYLDAQGNYVPPTQGRQVTPPRQYEANLRELVVRLRKTGARLIYATTTPVPAGTLGRVAGDERAYNAIARRVMAELGVPVDDLDAFVTSRQAELQLPRNVHFTDAGYLQLGAVVAASIETTLPLFYR